jgi:hypothetical protein
MADHTRIADLEAALKEVIVYLRALPLHPATTEKANKAEDVLRSRYSSVLQAGIRYSYGALIIGAQIEGMTLTLKTDSHQFASDIQHQINKGFYDLFVHGVQLEMKQPSGQFGNNFFHVEK